MPETTDTQTDTPTDPKSSTVAAETWDRFRYGVMRGHREYTFQAQRCERMYLGGGRQWDPIEAAALREQGREPYEFNEILPSVNSAIGHQIKNRLDIQFRPRGGNSDQVQADIRSKVAMQIADREHYHWKETEVFSDGLIQQRGFFDIRMKFDANMQGDATVTVRDPLDVIPDPDAKTYEPEGWSDVIVTRWLTSDEIAGDYGQEAADSVFAARHQDADFGEYDDTGALRPKFADPVLHGRYYDAFYKAGSIMRARIVERQMWVNSMSRGMYYPRTGDLKLAENLTPEVIAQQTAQGAVPTKAMMRRVKWIASTADTVLHNSWSPYNTFTIVPFFAYFRRGQTLGMVDNAIHPQQARNKALAQFVHIVNSAANSGWITEEDSISNMKLGELEQKGAMTGLHIEVKKGSTRPEKIQPNPVPTGVDRLIEVTTNALKSVTVPDAMRGQDGVDTSGIARQTQQHAAQQQIALPLDNLARTRHLVAEKFHELAQQFYTAERTIRITETDFRTGKPVDSAITINQFDPMTGTYLNDLTEGEYDVIASEQPMAVTFEDGQFSQAMDLRRVGVRIPDTVMVQTSSLSRKSDIVEQMSAEATQQPDPLTQAKIELLQAQITKTVNEAVGSAVTSMFSATQAANQIAAVPAVAPLADQLLQSAGFVDKNAAPIVPQALAEAAGPAANGPAQPATHPVPGGAAPAGTIEPENTHPNFPAHPDVGARSGIERSDPALGVTR